MPYGQNGLELLTWYKFPGPLGGKTIQPAWRFYATFLDNPFKTNEVRKKTGPMPIIRSFHIESVTLPQYTFTKEKQMWGALLRTFPVLKTEDWLQVEMTLEEDEIGTISYFINWCQKQIIDRDGYYEHPMENRIGSLIVEVQDKSGIPVVWYIYKDLYFIGTTSPVYSYKSSDQIKYNISFGCDVMKSYYPKYMMYNAAQKGLSNIGNSVAGRVRDRKIGLGKDSPEAKGFATDAKTIFGG